MNTGTETIPEAPARDAPARLSRIRRGWKRLIAACAVPTILACAESPVAPDGLDRVYSEVLEAVDPVPLEGTDRGGNGPPFPFSDEFRLD